MPIYEAKLKRAGISVITQTGRIRIEAAADHDLIRQPIALKDSN